MKNILFIICVITLNSCFRKKVEHALFLDFDTQKTINTAIPNIIYDPTSFSGGYVTYADSLSPYSFTILSSLKLITSGPERNKFKVSAQIRRAYATDKGSIEFQIISPNNELLYLKSVYITEDSFVKGNEWVKIEGEIVLPDDARIKELENPVKIFLYSTKNRIIMDDLEIISE